MITLSKCQFEIELLDDNCPRGFWGSRLRGIYGHSLKSRYCLDQEKHLCQTCKQSETCLYAALFEPARTQTDQSAKSRILAGGKLPPPYLFEPPKVDGPNDENYPAHTILIFNLITFGSRCSDISPAVQAFRQGFVFNSQGHKGHFALRKVTDLLNSDALVDLQSRNIHVTAENVISMTDGNLWGPDHDRLVVEFLTNTRVENQRARIKDSRTGLTIFSDFFDLIYNVLLRIGGLWELYGDNWPGSEEFKKGLDFYLKASRNVETVENTLEMHRPDEKELVRYSSRQDEYLSIEGFQGKMVFAGNTVPFANMLRIAEIIHLGNYTNIGLGRCSVTPR